MDETLAKRVLDEFMAVGNSKPNQYTVHFRQMCSNGPIYVLMQASADSLPLFNKLVCLMLHRFRRANVEISPFSTVKQQGCVLRIPTIESHVNLGERKVGKPRRAARKVHNRVRSRVVDYPLGVSDAQNVATLPREGGYLHT